VSWRALEAAAPELARRGRERLEEAGLALLGTLRADGSPRISPVEPFLAEGHLLFGVMTRSGKARDLARDRRCVVHSVVTDPNGTQGELKLYGRATDVDETLRQSAIEAWWIGRPAGHARVLSLEITHAVFVSWDADRGEMTVRRWSPEAGASEVARPYP
jgi:hypothetical protein